MFFRQLIVGILALVAAMPASAHGPDHGMGGGRPGDPAKITRTIEFVASDNEFSLKSLQICAQVHDGTLGLHGLGLARGLDHLEITG